MFYGVKKVSRNRMKDLNVVRNECWLSSVMSVEVLMIVRMKNRCCMWLIFSWLCMLLMMVVMYMKLL